MNLLDCVFGDWSWWRRMRPGRWEKWWVMGGPIIGEIWLHGHHKPEGLMRELRAVEYQ